MSSSENKEQKAADSAPQLDGAAKSARTAKELSDALHAGLVAAEQTLLAPLAALKACTDPDAVKQVQEGARYALSVELYTRIAEWYSEQTKNTMLDTAGLPAPTGASKKALTVNLSTHFLPSLLGTGTSYYYWSVSR